MDTPLLPVLSHVEAISACRDRRQLAQLLVRATADLLGQAADIAFFRQEREDGAEIAIALGPTVMAAALGPWQELLDGRLLPGKATTQSVNGRVFATLPLQASEVGGRKTYLAFAAEESRLLLHLDELLCISRVYGNQIRLLDYSELDSLTRLLNRKTFDETFDRLLETEEADEDDLEIERRNAPTGDAWLCVIDIDHFKRINDTFGHLFGDEVLLRVGDLMRKTFRSDDRLFRFGGEEFVVILNAEGADNAARGFDRFRHAVEKHEFPQVGQVTCSIGFTRAGGAEVPTDVLGRADEALYYGKEHGRNQVNGYEQLVAAGSVATPVAAEATADADFDIDALFE